MVRHSNISRTYYASTCYLVFTYMSSNLNRIGPKSSCHLNTFTHCLVFKIPLVLTLGSCLYGRTVIYPGLPGGSSVFYPLTAVIVDSAPFYSQKGSQFHRHSIFWCFLEKNLNSIKVDQNIKHYKCSFFPQKGNATYIIRERVVSELVWGLFLEAASLGLHSL